MTKNLDNLTELSANQLAHMAGCSSPDSPSSPGATFLNNVRDSFVDLIRSDPELLDDFDDTAEEIAQDAPDVYTNSLWSEFVDLSGYREDINEYLTELPDNPDNIATTALYMIAKRLAYALADITDSE